MAVLIIYVLKDKVDFFSLCDVVSISMVKQVTEKIYNTCNILNSNTNMPGQLIYG